MSLHYIHDTNGNTTGAFIPIDDWQLLKEKYSELQIEEVQEHTELTDWQKEIIDKRLHDYFTNPNDVLDFNFTLKEIQDMKQYQTVNKPLVYVDILNAVEFYKEINPNLAHQFLCCPPKTRQNIHII